MIVRRRFSCCFNLLIKNMSNKLFCFCVSITVPVDVFSPNSEWSGFYEYLGKRQVTTFTVTVYNATSGRVNVTLLETSGVSIRLSGKKNTKKTLIHFTLSNFTKYQMLLLCHLNVLRV